MEIHQRKFVRSCKWNDATEKKFMWRDDFSRSAIKTFSDLQEIILYLQAHSNNLSPFSKSQLGKFLEVSGLVIFPKFANFPGYVRDFTFLHNL